MDKIDLIEMKPLLIIIWLLTCPRLMAQEAFWISGGAQGAPPFGNTIFKFTNSQLVLDSGNFNLNFSRACSTISDSSDNLLFYTNGFAICNDLMDTIPDGSGLDSTPDLSLNSYPYGNPFMQATLLIPLPGSVDSFYLFHETGRIIQLPSFGTYYAPNLYYTIIDKSLNGGHGAVVNRQAPIITDTLQIGRITGCKHGNGRDWWIIVRKFGSNIFYKLLFTPNGIEPITQQGLGDSLFYGDIGQCVFRPDGTQYATIDHRTDLNIYDFDRCSGMFSNFIHIALPDSQVPRGVAYSPSGRFLYVSSSLYMYQFDTYNPNIASTKDTVAVYDFFSSPSPPAYTTFYSLQLARDNKIYCSSSNGVLSMHVIESPDSSGVNCNVCQHCITLPTYNAYTVPNFPNFNLTAAIGTICDSLTTGIAVNDELSNIKIYPNPTQDIINMSNLPIGVHEVKMLDSFGRTVLRKTINTKLNNASDILSIKEFPSGLYFIEIFIGKYHYYMRVVKYN